MNALKLPAGLNDCAVELFSVGEFKLRALHKGQVVEFGHLPEYITKVLQCFVECIMGRTAECLERDCWCLFGGYDGKADVDCNAQTIEPEYWDCGLREKCPHTVRICIKSPATPSGRALSKREIEYVTLRARGLQNKEIADKMGVA
ncbi:MAG: hypothetical protein ACRC9X_03255, partial [Bacteroidales bacterium]